MTTEQLIMNRSCNMTYTGWKRALDQLLLLSIKLNQYNTDYTKHPIPIDIKVKLIAATINDHVKSYDCIIVDDAFISTDEEHRIFKFDNYDQIMILDYHATIDLGRFIVHIRYHIDKISHGGARVYELYHIDSDIMNIHYMNGNMIYPIDMQRMLFRYEHMKYLFDFIYIHRDRVSIEIHQTSGTNHIGDFKLYVNGKYLSHFHFADNVDYNEKKTGHILMYLHGEIPDILTGYGTVKVIKQHIK